MKNYKWIYSKNNFLNSVDKFKLKKFFDTTYDFELGWEPEANSIKNEFLNRKD